MNIKYTVIITPQMIELFGSVDNAKQTVLRILKSRIKNVKWCTYIDKT